MWQNFYEAFFVMQNIDIKTGEKLKFRFKNSRFLPQQNIFPLIGGVFLVVCKAVLTVC